MKLHRMYLVFMLLAMSVTTAWSAPVTAYVAEFNVLGASKPEEMKTTIQALLLSRLAGKTISTQTKPEGAAIKVSGTYIVSGSVFSLDAAAVNSAGAILARAFVQGNSPDELIPAIGSLAKSLSDGIGKGAVAVASPTVAVQALVLPADIIIPVLEPTLRTTGQAIHRLKGGLNGLAVGQTFPGGDRELFVVGPSTLRYYRQGAELKLLAEIRYKVYEKVLAVDSADLDNNKIPEIYVTVMDGEKLVSQVWTVDGTTLKKIAGPLPYYFRAVTATGGIKKLYAQQISGKDDFSGDVAEVVKSGSGYGLINPLKLPKQGYLYNFNLLSSTKGEQNQVITDRSGYLRVYSAAGDELWKSSEEFGGSETNFKRTDLGSDFRPVFLEQRMIVKANGELLVAKNSASWLMLNKHSYAHSSMYCFSWNGTDLEEKWHTKPNDYYLADFAYDDSSRELLLLEVVDKEEGIFDKGASRLVIRKME
jgi:hypothetical protein